MRIYDNRATRLEEGDTSPNGVETVYARAWQASPLAILTLDDEGSIRSWNPASQQLFAREPSELGGARLTALAHAMDRPILSQMLAEAAAGDTPQRQEIRFLRPDSTDVVTGFSVSAASQGAGGVCVLRDLTHEQALRPQMLHTQRMASMGTVASVVAHELNNALGGALGCLQLLLDHGDASVREAVQIASSEISRAGEIVRDLKQFARTEEGMSQVVSLRSLAERATRLYRFDPASARHDVVVDLRMDPRAPDVKGNENQLMQATLNLLRNAGDEVARLEPERRNVTLAVRGSEGVAILEVIDHGRGVPPDKRARIFEPFYSSKRAGEGTGLGLAVVQAIMAGHGGRIELVETLGGGATFRVTLPADDGEAQSGEQPVERARPRATLRGCTVLVADDEPILQLVVDRACKKQGATVELASDALEAIALVDDHTFDALVLDVRMPGGGRRRRVPPRAGASPRARPQDGVHER